MVASYADPEMFQSTRPCGARRKNVDGDSGTLVVSIHAPVRGATQRLRFCGIPLLRFNPRARAGRDPSAPALPCREYRFNPRARAGRDWVEIAACLVDKSVSIHAPVRGATIKIRVYNRV